MSTLTAPPVPAQRQAPGPFRFLSWVEMQQQAECAPFLVDGLVCSSLTLFIGEPEAGKSTLAAVLVAAALRGEPFLDRALTRPISRVVFLGTEMGAVGELAPRLRSAGLPPDDVPGLRFLAVRGLSADDWRTLAAQVDPGPDTLVVLDNLSQVLGEGSINDDAAVRMVTDGLARFEAAGAAVVLVHHVSEKRTAHGGKNRSPMGSTLISAAARWTVRIERESRSGTLLLDCHGNGAPPHKVRLRQGSVVTDVTVCEEIDAQAVAKERRERDRAQGQWLMEVARWAVEHHLHAATAADMSRALVAQFPSLAGGSNPARVVAGHLSSGAKIGAFLRNGDDGWEVTGHGS